MEITVLASSSKGNCYYIEYNNTKILLDIGISYKVLKQKLNDINKDVSEIDALLITHEHSDHIKGLKTLNKNEYLNIYMREKAKSKIEHLLEYEYNYNEIVEKEFHIGDIKCTWFFLSHDAKDPISYIFEVEDKKVVFVTDTGYINETNLNLIEDATMYLIETNYDDMMLNSNSKYPYNIISRIRSDYGHLSNDDAGRYLSEITTTNTKYVVLCHLSPENNYSELAYETIKNYINSNIEIHVSDRYESSKVFKL